MDLCTGEKDIFQGMSWIGSKLTHEVVVDELGNQILHFRFLNLPPFATKVISIRAELQMSSIPGLLSSENNLLFLVPEDYIQSNSPEIINLSRKLTKPTVPETVTSIFKWFEGNVTYSGYDSMRSKEKRKVLDKNFKSNSAMGITF